MAKTVLVVDDEDDIRAFVAGILADCGWCVVEAENGREAIQLALLEMPDLAIIDIMMPAMNGFDLYQELRSASETEHIPIIVLSSVNDFELGSKHSAESMGENAGLRDPEGFVEKPIEGQALRALVERIAG